MSYTDKIKDLDISLLQKYLDTITELIHENLALKMDIAHLKLQVDMTQKERVNKFFGGKK